MEITVGSITDFLAGHAKDCELQKTPLTMCTAMAMNPELYGMAQTRRCTCGKGGVILGIKNPR